MDDPADLIDPIPADEMTSDQPRAFIERRFHPRTGLPASLKYLDEVDNEDTAPPSVPPDCDCKPFPNYASFDYAENCINSNRSRADINHFLTRMHDGTYCEKGSSKIPFKNADQLLKTVDDYSNLFPKVSLFSNAV